VGWAERRNKKKGRSTAAGLVYAKIRFSPVQNPIGLSEGVRQNRPLIPSTPPPELNEIYDVRSQYSGKKRNRSSSPQHVPDEMFTTGRIRLDLISDGTGLETKTIPQISFVTYIRERDRKCAVNAVV